MRSSASASRESRTSAVRCCHILELEEHCTAGIGWDELSGRARSAVGFSACSLGKDSLLDAMFSQPADVDI